MPEQKSIDVLYLEEIKNVDGCPYYRSHHEDDSRIFSVREVMFCAYNGNCPHQSENEYFFKGVETAIRQCKLGSTKSIEEILEDTGMFLFKLVEKKEEISAVVS